MLLKTTRVLLDPSEGEGQPAASPPVLSDQAAIFKGSASPPISAKPGPRMPEELKGQTFNLSDDDSLMDYGQNADTAIVGDNLQKKTGQAVEEEPDDNAPAPKKEEQKVEAKTEGEPDAKPKFKAGLPERPLKTTTAVAPTTEARDYSIFPEDMREHLKKTSNESFNFIRDRYKELEATKKELGELKPKYDAIQQNGYPESWLEHPEAWRLHPEAQQAIAKAERMSFEENHWTEQVDLIKAGKQYTTIEGYRRDGSPVYSAPQEPSEAAADTALRNAIQLQQMKQQTYLGVNQFASTFKQQMQGQQQAIDNLITEQWPWHKDEKHEAQKWVKEFMDILPPVVPVETMKKVAALMYSSYQKALELLHDKQEEVKKEEIKKENKVATEPRTSAPTPVSGANKNSGGKFKGAPATFDLEGMLT